jgi:hypothetical protein
MSILLEFFSPAACLVICGARGNFKIPRRAESHCTTEIRAGVARSEERDVN